MSVEDVSIPNAQTGEIYIIMITNYNEGAGYISLQQVGGAGTTDCSILETTLPGDQEFCEGEDYTIDGTTIGATSYQWSIYNEATDTYDLLPELKSLPLQRQSQHLKQYLPHLFP